LSYGRRRRHRNRLAGPVGWADGAGSKVL
jgi:hypothetical protein